MKTQRLLLPLLCLYFFAGIGLAQPEEQPPNNVSPKRQAVEDTLGTAGERAMYKASLRILWNSNGAITSAMLMHDEGFREFLGISEEQYQQAAELDVENTAALEEELYADSENLRKTAAEMLENADSFDEATMLEALTDFENAATDIVQKTMSVMIDQITEGMNAILNPEQILKSHEIELAAMGELPFISPSAFEALNLTDEQRQEMENIKKELEPEFEKNLDDFVESYMALEKILESEHAKGIKTSEGGQETREETRKRLMAENSEYKRMQEEILSRSRTFSTQFRTRMFDVLTDEQWKRLQELIDNPPEYAKIFIKELRESMGLVESEKSGEGGDEGGASPPVWMPGPGSWQPGDAIPDAYRQERNTRGNFPRSEN